METLICILLSIVMIQNAAGLECVIEDLKNYGDSIRSCNSVKTLTFNVTNWGLVQPDLVNKTNSINSIDVRNQSLRDIEKGFCAWPKLTTINANLNIITSLHSNLLNGCSNLERLTLSKNNISTIDDYAFQNLTSLEVLDLSNNQIDKLNANMLRPLTFLKELLLNENLLQVIESNTFSSTSSLATLNLSNNLLQFIDENLFRNLKKLIKLDISSNSKLASVNLDGMDRLDFVNLDNASFTKLNIPSKVVKISANFNNISTISIDPKSLIEQLTLRHNSLWNINNLSGATQLTVLDISYNNFSEIDFSVLQSTKIQKIGIIGNQIQKFDVNKLISLPFIKTIEITKETLDNKTLADLTSVTTTTPSNASVLFVNHTRERQNFVNTVQMRTNSSNVQNKNSNLTLESSKSSVSDQNMTFNPTVKSTPNSSDLIKVNVHLSESIQTLGSKYETIANSVDQLKVTLYWIKIGLLLFVLFCIVLFVYRNYDRWNSFNPSQEFGIWYHHRTRTNIDGTTEPMIGSLY